MSQTCIILAGGFGTRLQSLVNNLPKPMAPVNGKPFLDYQLQKLTRAGITQVIFSTGYLAQKITERYGNRFEQITIDYSHETTPLGTGGAIRLALNKVSENDVLVINGDSFFDIPINELIAYHKKDNNDCSMALRKVPDASRYGSVVVNNNRITSFAEKSEQITGGTINGGVYLINKKIYTENTPAVSAFSVEKDFFETQCSKLKIGGYVFNSYFIDIGIPDDYKKAQHDFERFSY